MRRLLMCVVMACLSMTLAAQRGERRPMRDDESRTERREPRAEREGMQNPEMRERAMERRQGRREVIRERMQHLRQRLSEQRGDRHRQSGAPVDRRVPRGDRPRAERQNGASGRERGVRGEGRRPNAEGPIEQARGRLRRGDEARSRVAPEGSQARRRVRGPAVDD